MSHSYASRALSVGESLPMIGCLLGHLNVEATKGYARLAPDWLRVSAVRISENVAENTVRGRME